MYKRKTYSKVLRVIKHSYLISILMLFGFISSYAQDFKTDLKSLYRVILDNKEISTDVDILVKGTPVGNLNKKAQIRKSGDSFYYKLDDVEMLLTSKTFILVDNHNKTIICRPVTKKESNQMKKKVLKTDLDSMLQRYDSVVYKGEINGQKRYVIYVSKQAIELADFYLNPTTGFLSKVTFKYNPKFKTSVDEVVILYSPLETASQSTNPCLFEKTYFIQEGKKLKPGPKYKNYQIKALNS